MKGTVYIYPAPRHPEGIDLPFGQGMQVGRELQSRAGIHGVISAARPEYVEISWDDGAIESFSWHQNQWLYMRHSLD